MPSREHEYMVHATECWYEASECYRMLGVYCLYPFVRSFLLLINGSLSK